MVQERTVEDLSATATAPMFVDEAEATEPSCAKEAKCHVADGRSSALDAFRSTYKQQLDMLLTRVQETRMFAAVLRTTHVLHSRASASGTHPLYVTLLLLALPLADIGLPSPLAHEWIQVWSLDRVPEFVKHEVQGLRAQVDALVKTWCDECGMTRDQGERAGKCGKRKREADGGAEEDEEEPEEKRLKTDTDEAGLSFSPSPSPSPSPDADSTEHDGGCCCKQDESAGPRVLVRVASEKGMIDINSICT
ncbi:hypothetical protein BCR44DRAFT_1136001 [Catenaria anguillulae PL171]|uniref:Uncharacterized protein n=1 Tax=Catenaria anguillulae PL171 TaxID=765915 RepID=A0A1Y2HJT1_9FUNG|nr:hypothetical protein BCR44DRAFT_1136001 [Catenaria anguillulae PL171]